jgi:hypothetical protein
MLAIYTLSLVIGGLFLILAIIFGHEHDLLHHGSPDDGPGISNLKVIMAFLTAFGAAGLLATYYGAGVGVSAGSAVLGGLALGGLVMVLLQRVYQEQANSYVTTASIIGKQGVLLVGINSSTAGIDLGEVSIRLPNGSTQTFIAKTRWRHDVLHAGQTVTILAVNGQIATVEAVREQASA